MKTYYVLIPDAEEFSVIKETICKRALVHTDLAVLSVDPKESKHTPPEMSVMFMQGSERYYVHFIQSGVGKIATCKTMKYLLTVFRDYIRPDSVIMAGSAGGKYPGVYNVFNMYHDIDLTTAGRGMGESPDLPLYYQSTDLLRFPDLCIADSLTADNNHSVPNPTLYKGMSTVSVVDMEDYAFAAMMQDEDIPYGVVRVVTDEGDYEDWKSSLHDSMIKLLDVLLDHFNN